MGLLWFMSSSMEEQKLFSQRKDSLAPLSIMNPTQPQWEKWIDDLTYNSDLSNDESDRLNVRLKSFIATVEHDAYAEGERDTANILKLYTPDSGNVPKGVDLEVLKHTLDNVHKIADQIIKEGEK